MRRLTLTCASLLAFGLAMPALGAGEDEGFPNRTVKIVVPFPPGGTADLLPRALAEKISVAWKRPIVIENRPGAAGNTGAKAVADAPADGYMLLSSPPGPLAINQSIFRTMPYDPAKLVPVSLMATSPIVLTIRTSLAANTLQELIALAKASPGKLTYASSGSGSTPHLVGAMLASAGKLQLLHVPYKGTAPAVNDLIGGQVDLYFDNLANALPHSKSGRVKLLGLASEKRSALIPAVPTMAEAGLPGFIAATWYGAALPPGTPPALVAKWNAALNDALASPDLQKRMADWGLEPAGGSAADAAVFFRAEAAKWKAVAAEANVVLD